MKTDIRRLRENDNRQPYHRRRMMIPSGDDGGSIHRMVGFWIGSRVYSASLNVLRSGEANFIGVDIDEPVDMLLTRVEVVHKKLVVGIVKLLNELDILPIDYEEVNVRFDVHPQRVPVINSKLERYTVFLELTPTLPQEGVSPRVHLAAVTIYLKNPRFAHARSVLRRWKRRRKIKKLIAQHKRAASAGSPRSPLVERDGYRNIDEEES
ncbi:hypothetical protein HMPREF3227_02513 [Corynebacterium sp. CMW7794]|uniref:hypothetical protein n=1 Tax=unclassified Corynebacterium TaxID=2624378 RepID=UPI00079A328F|nr:MULTISPECIES: hypothetical protein [unclassified Corynebacterium]KXI15222.1 hypothetical protein HMPREF3227_02513 [Corynebacterium sp. CMW7794]OFP17471.1 hypothetical protein HMPREF2998_02455 [Corynebacterium sp. HMSC065A05]